METATPGIYVGHCDDINPFDNPRQQPPLDESFPCYKLLVDGPDGVGDPAAEIECFWFLNVARAGQWKGEIERLQRECAALAKGEQRVGHDFISWLNNMNAFICTWGLTSVPRQVQRSHQAVLHCIGMDPHDYPDSIFAVKVAVPASASDHGVFVCHIDDDSPCDVLGEPLPGVYHTLEYVGASEIENFIFMSQARADQWVEDINRVRNERSREKDSAFLDDPCALISLWRSWLNIMEHFILTWGLASVPREIQRVHHEVESFLGLPKTTLYPNVRHDAEE